MFNAKNYPCGAMAINNLKRSAGINIYNFVIK
jgi:hypothetical protein